MTIVALDNFIKNIPFDKKDIIINEVINFRDTFIANNYDARSIPNSYSVRKISHNIHNVTILKFRINRSDRILFTFSSELNNFITCKPDKSTIIFLDYCSHDKQIVRGRQINVVADKISDYDWDEDWDNAIDNEYKDFYYNPNNIISRIITIKEMAAMFDNHEKRAVYYLNDEQFDCIKENIKPLFLFGSAGSGKTTVSVYKCIILCQQYNKIGYFTHSQKLVEESVSLFQEICRQEDLSNYNSKVSFNQLNSYMKSLLAVPSFIEYPEFKAWFYNSIAVAPQYKTYKFDPLMVWREIRGIIKGLFYIDWLSCKYKKDLLSQETIAFLCKRKFAVLDKDYLLIKSDELFKIDISNESGSEKNDIIRNEITKIYEEIERDVFSKKLMELSAYLSLPKSYSLFDSNEKHVIYDIALSYERHKNNHNLIDENDMIHRAFIDKHGFNMFDYLIVDEVQDLTEKQIYYLYKLSKNPVNILFSGDVNQTVSPTFFDEGRISAIFMFRYGFNGFITRTIESNYRNSLNIVNFSKKLFLLKTERINRHLNSYNEKPLRNEKGKIFLMENSDKNLQRLMASAAQRHYVSLIVVDEDAKLRIANTLSGVSVYTVSEIKGLENDYIVCYNILTTFKQLWTDIFSGKAENSYLYLFIFNILYVSVTRAKNNVCFYEDDPPQEFVSYFSNNITYVHNFNEKTLLLEKKSTENEFYKEGIRLEKEGFFKQAITNYINSGLSNDSIEVIRCEALDKRKSGHFIEAAGMLMDINECILAAECYKESSDYINALKALVYASYPFDKTIEFFRPFNINPLELAAEVNTSWSLNFYRDYHKYLIGKLTICKQLNIDSKNMMTDLKNKLFKKSKGVKFI